MKKKILAIILARSGSKRIKNKNIKKFNNKPLIHWTLDVAIKSKKFHDIVVSSDSSKILKIAKYNSKKILTLKRPKKLSLDNSSSEIAALHAVKWYEKKFYKIDYIALLQPTSPFRSLRTINKGIEEIYNSKINAVISVRKTRSNDIRNKLFYLTKNKLCKRIKVNNELTPSYIINGIFYLIKKKYFFKNNSFSPSIFKPLILSSKKENIDLDTKIDWEYAKKFL
jgi:CMP-N,N'-diacetyllegionaminic acid synthase|tara:strand:+ start:442 stop:1116 length:675 start_codon:yes stop_codon:yes gene_type:complete